MAVEEDGFPVWEQRETRATVDADIGKQRKHREPEGQRAGHGRTGQGSEGKIEMGREGGQRTEGEDKARKREGK